MNSFVLMLGKISARAIRISLCFEQRVRAILSQAGRIGSKGGWELLSGAAPIVKDGWRNLIDCEGLIERGSVSIDETDLVLTAGKKAERDFLGVRDEIHQAIAAITHGI